MARFVIQLRELKDAGGLTLRELADGTGYSSSSWERYLGGRSLPPRAAVEACARSAGGDAVRLLALFDMAEDAWQRQPDLPDAGTPNEPAAPPAADPDGTAREPDPATGAAPGPDATVRRPALWRRAVTLGCAVALGAAITLLVVRPGTGAVAAPAPSPTPTVPKAPVFTCTYSRRAGLWYAGNSTTHTQQLVVEMSGPAVAELQCLLQRAGITPGGIDGGFGPLTESAVIQAQKKFKLDVDGQVGPHTWAALRR